MEVWDQLEPGEQRRIIEGALSRLEPRQRQAFLAHVLEGFDAAEIAMMQDREEREIVADIEQARQTLCREIAERSEPTSLAS